MFTSRRLWILPLVGGGEDPDSLLGFCSAAPFPRRCRRWSRFPARILQCRSLPSPASEAMDSLFRHRGFVLHILDPCGSRDFVRGDPVFGSCSPRLVEAPRLAFCPFVRRVFFASSPKTLLSHPVRFGFSFAPDRQTSDKPRPRPIDRQLSHMPRIPSPDRQISAKCSAVCYAHWHSPSAAWGIFPLTILAIPHDRAVHTLGWGIFTLD